MHEKGPFVRVENTRDRAKQSRLSGATRAEQSNTFASPDLQVEAP